MLTRRCATSSWNHLWLSQLVITQALVQVYSRIVRLNRPLLGRGYQPNSAYRYSTDQCVKAARSLILSNHGLLEIATSNWWSRFSLRSPCRLPSTADGDLSSLQCTLVLSQVRSCSSWTCSTRSTTTRRRTRSRRYVFFRPFSITGDTNATGGYLSRSATF